MRIRLLLHTLLVLCSLISLFKILARPVAFTRLYSPLFFLVKSSSFEIVFVGLNIVCLRIVTCEVLSVFA